jgi:hypothetical protein
MKDEALKLALEALQNSVDLVREDAYNAEKLYGNYPTRQGKVRGLKVLADDHENAITAIKQALAAQPTAYAGYHITTDKVEIFMSEKQAIDWRDQYKPGFARVEKLVSGGVVE